MLVRKTPGSFLENIPGADIIENSPESNQASGRKRQEFQVSVENI
jgi:hypothetical protein